MQNLPITLKPSKIKHIILLLFSIGFVISGILLLDKNLWIAILNMVFFGMCSIIFAINIFPNSSYLKIDEKGIEMKNLFRSTLIPWQAVKGFRAKSVVFNKLVVFDLDEHLPDEKLKRKQGGFPDTYGMSAQKLANLLNEYKAKLDLL